MATLKIDTPSPMASEALGLVVAPNPAFGHAVACIQLPGPGSVGLSLYSIAGVRVWSHTLGRLESGQGKVDLDTEGLPTGIYLAVLEYQDDSGHRNYALFKWALER